MNVIGKRSCILLVDAIASVIFAAISVPLTLKFIFFGDVGGYVFFAVWNGVVASIVLYHVYFFITVPKNVILPDEKNSSVTVYVTRRKKKVFKLDEIKNIRLRRPIVTYRRMVAHIVFEAKNGERAKARFITDPKSVSFALLKK